MKKIIALVLIGLAITATNAFGQSSLLNVKGYAEIFGFQKSVVDPDNDFIFEASRAERTGEISNLGGMERRVDTPLELALFSYYATSRISVRPAEADAILPKNNPKLADQKLGAAVFQEMQVLRFLGDTAAVSRHEAVLKFITDRGNVTRAEVEKYYRDGIGAYISDAVEELFNKTSFFIENIIGSVAKSYNGVLTRDPKNGQYKLSYEDAKDITKELSALSLEALSSAMSASGDFSQAAIDTVKARAALIPAVVYADWKAKGATNGVDGMALIKEVLTNFYLNPSKGTYDVICGIVARYTITGSSMSDPFARVAGGNFGSLLFLLNDGLGSKVAADTSGAGLRAMARIPNDQRYNVFSTRYAGDVKEGGAE